MTLSGPTRGVAALVLVLWMISGAAVATHSHCDCGACHHEHEDVPCQICVAVAFAPAIVVARGESVEVERDVVAWIAPWIALVPQDVFFDRPLARGPPPLS